ncbi:MAG: polysaccharide deacetylase [Alphaproteobacteria bacterium]|nr:polysaccharide deacetylase [Alphaproteobacteria bacterium]
MLSFDFDAESIWLARDPENARRIGTLSQGLYGAKRAVPKIMELLAEERLPATFFIPGWVVEHHTDRCKEIRDAGYEIGHPGYSHEWADPERPEKEAAELDRASEAMDRLLGLRPLGYRPPAAEITHNTMRLLAERGFLYNSNMLDDVFPYRHVLADGREGPVELPTHWSLGDANYALTAIRHPRTIMPNAHILQIWQDEFTELYRWGAYVNLVLHPQVIGRPSRLALLRQFIAFTRRFPGVWYATGAEIAEAFAAQERR